MIDLSEISSAHFTPRLGDEFKASSQDEAAIILKLIDISEGAQRDSISRQAFTLTFEGGKEQPLVQAIYTLANAEFGEADIFLVPVGPGNNGLLYEAVFT